MKIGRNSPCPCSSGKKYKFCCEKTASTKGDWSKIALALVGLVLLFGAVGMVTTLIRSDGLGPEGMVWSAEHGHWHTADGQELGAAIPKPQPPGPAPAGKVWSPEHGHWHDADGQELGAAVPTPLPPGPAPAGKVWSPEHGHWHDAE